MQSLLMLEDRQWYVAPVLALVLVLVLVLHLKRLSISIVRSVDVLWYERIALLNE